MESDAQSLEPVSKLIPQGDAKAADTGADQPNERLTGGIIASDQRQRHQAE
jgi:hypothetical protein